MAKAQRKAKAEPAALLKLDLGCGKNPREGFTGVDSRNFGQPITADLRKKWPWADNSVAEVHCSHFVEHLTAAERVHFVNELYRILVPEGKAKIVAPHWNSPRAFGDLTHQWPPVSEWWFLYVNKGWREVNAPHSDYNPEVNFEVAYAPILRADIAQRNQEYQMYAYANYKDAAQDLDSTWTKK